MKIHIFELHKNQATTAKRQLIKALQHRNIAAIQIFMAQGRKILGADKLTDLIVNEVMLECDADSYSWFWQTFLGQSRYEEIQRKAQNQVFQMLVNIGLEPGKDFSFGLDSEMMISDRTQETLLSTYAGTTNFSLPASPKAL